MDTFVVSLVLTGRVSIAAGADSFTNNAGGVWNSSGGTTATTSGPANQFGNGSTITNAVGGFININANSTTSFPSNFEGFTFTNTGAQTGTNSITNSGVTNSAGSVNFQFQGAGSATVINNTPIPGGSAVSGIFNVGSVPGSLTESTSFTSAGIQTVTNTGTFNLFGHGTGTATIGTGGVTATGPSGVGALNFEGATGSAAPDRIRGRRRLRRTVRPPPYPPPLRAAVALPAR